MERNSVDSNVVTNQHVDDVILLSYTKYLVTVDLVTDLATDDPRNNICWVPLTFITKH